MCSYSQARLVPKGIWAPRVQKAKPVWPVPQVQLARLGRSAPLVVQAPLVPLDQKEIPDRWDRRETWVPQGPRALRGTLGLLALKVTPDPSVPPGPRVILERPDQREILDPSVRKAK